MTRTLRTWVVVVALGLSRLLSSLLYGVSTWDPAVFAAVACLLMIAGTAAALVPAHRASKADAMVSLRCE